MSAVPAAGGAGTEFPWDEAMAAAFGLLRLAPAAFWAMTPREFAAALSPFTKASAPPPRAALEALMRRFPDLA